MQATIRPVRESIAVIPAPAVRVPHEPAPRPAAALIIALIETMSGRRALHQVRRHASACAVQQLATFVDSRLLHAARVFRMRTQMPTPESVEAAVTLLCDGRFVACVVRLDVTDGRWACSELTVLTPAALAAA